MLFIFGNGSKLTHPNILFLLGTCYKAGQEALSIFLCFAYCSYGVLYKLVIR